jgi:exonuclease III
MRILWSSDGTKWLIVGDFNLINNAKDKNNRKEIHLQNRKFTWSSERRRPTMSQIDRFFYNEAWDVTFDDHTLPLCEKLTLVTGIYRLW